MSGNPPQELRLPSNMQITCLHNQHCFTAVHQFLHSDDKWWMVSLYNDSMHIFLLYIKLSDYHHKNCQMTSARTWSIISPTSSHFMTVISFIICSVPKCKETHKSQSINEQSSAILNTRTSDHFNIKRSIHSSMMHWMDCFLCRACGPHYKLESFIKFCTWSAWKWDRLSICANTSADKTTETWILHKTHSHHILSNVQWEC